MTTIDHLMWIIAAGSLVGTIANVYKKRWCFLLWSIGNFAWVLYDVHKTAYPQAALMAVYFCLAIWGWFRWSKEPSDA